MTTLDDAFPELFGQIEWIESRATKFKVYTMESVEPDHPSIAMSIEAVDQGGEFTREEAERHVVLLEKNGTAAWFTPTREEFYRLLAEWKKMKGGQS